jgi:hypothetical protein
MAWTSTSIGFFTTDTEFRSLGAGGGTVIVAQSGSLLGVNLSLTLDDIFSPSVVVSQSRTHHDVLVLDGVTLYGGELSNAAIVADTAASASLAAAISGGLWAASSNNYFSSSTDYSVYYPFVNRNTGVTSSLARVTGFEFPGGGLVFLLFENNTVTFEDQSNLIPSYGVSYAGEMAAPHRLVYLIGDTSSLNPNELGYPLSSSLSAGTFGYVSPVGPESGGGGGGISTTSGVGGTGYAYTFGGQSQSILVRHNSNFDVFNKNDDWGISFWASLPHSQSGTDTEKLIVSKHIAERYINEDGTITTQNSEVGSYPFKVGVYTSYSDVNGKVFFETSDGTSTNRVTSSAQYNDGSYRHFAFNKTGSLYEIWVNGARVASQSVSYPFNINNQKDILIGNDSYGGSSAFSGSLDEFQIHRTTLTPSEIGSLADNNSVSGSYLQKNDVGYVFYKQGMIVVTDPRPRYQNVLLGLGDISYDNDHNFQVDYRSTKVVEEVVALCEIGKEEFLVTSNPSARYTPSENEFQLAGFTMSSSFYPYVTTLGLYNDMGDLLATAKLGSPLKRRSDVDVTIQVKFDID